MGLSVVKTFLQVLVLVLERLITHLSWLLEVVEELVLVLKVLVVLEVVEEALEMRCLSFWIWVFLYCRNVFSLLLKMVLCRFVKAWSSGFCYRDVFVLAISVWRWLILILVHLILLWMSEHSAFFFLAVQTSCPSISFAMFLVLLFLLGI